MMNFLKTVQEIYEAFKKGDIATILNHLDEHVEWEYGMFPNHVPWLQPLQGRQNVVKFFESLMELELQIFTVKELIGDDKVVVALIDLEGIVKRNGHKIYEKDEVHIWRFNTEGKVVGFRHRVDTHQHIQAYDN